MKIGIISDTHKKVKKTKKALAQLIEDGAEFIIHAGDIVEVEILQMLKNSSLRYVAVYGNNDAHLTQYHENFELVQEPFYFKLDGLKFKLMHLPYYLTPDADIVVFGHTHQFEVALEGKTLFLNSGEVCARKKPVTEFAMLETSKESFVVTHYEKGEDEIGFRQTQHSFKRELKS